MAQTIKITYYGMDGEGRTVKEAKADAGTKIEAALKGIKDSSSANRD